MFCLPNFVFSFNPHLKTVNLSAGILFAKKKLYTECAREINKIKVEIDKCKKHLEDCSKERHRLGKKFINSIIYICCRRKEIVLRDRSMVYKTSSLLLSNYSCIFFKKSQKI